MSERRSQRLQRRAVSVPSMLGMTAMALLGFPLIVLALVVRDLARGKVRLPSLRVYLFTLQYVVNDSVEIVAAPFLWAAAGFGRRLGSTASIARHRRLQWWSLQLLTKRADQLLGLRIEIDPDSEAALLPGPVIVVSRHVSLFDASLPGIVYEQRGIAVRGVIMAELLADPGFDLIYGRLGSVFIPRDDGPAALAEVQRMADGAEPGSAFVIFPEGRLFDPAVRDRSLARLADSAPERAARFASATNVLPLRPGGLLALLDALPDADVVLIDHDGLDAFPKLADLAGAVPVTRPVRVLARRIARDDIPVERGDRIAWLDDLWLELDAAVGSRRSTTA